jgi:hypothetical protein
LENLKLRNYVNIITSKDCLKQFKNDKEDVKIWLHNDDKIDAAVHQRFYDTISSKFFTEKIDEKKIKVGFATKSISQNPEFCIDIKGKTVSYEEFNTFSYIFGIIGAAVGVENKNEIRFHSLFAIMHNVELPFETYEKMYGINDVIKRMLPFKNIKFSEDSLATFNSICEKDDKWKIFIPMNSKETTPKAIRKFAECYNSLGPDNIDWILGNLNNNSEIDETGFLFIIKNGRVIATCLDELDMKFLGEMFTSRREEVLALLKPKQMQYSFYPERAKSAEIIIKIIERDNPENLNITEYGLKSFEETQGESSTSSTKYQNLHRG